MRSHPLFNQVAIVGVGLIGGSLGLAIRRGHLARKVIGFSRHESTIRQAKARGAIDEGDTELCPEWLGQSDLVVIATPPEAVVEIAQRVERLTQGPLIITDVASTKRRIVETLEKSLSGRISFVGSHPMAGSEQSGIFAARGDLFKGAASVVTRTGRTRIPALRKVSELWRRVGARVAYLTPSRHDRLVAQISHVPHLVSVTLARTVDREAWSLSGGGFAGVTRLALSDPELWEEIVRMNWKEVNRALGRLIKHLERLRRDIRQGAIRKLLNELRMAQSRRRQLEKAKTGR